MKKIKLAVEQLQEMATLSPKVQKYIQDNFPDVLKPKLEYNRWIKNDLNPDWMVFHSENKYYGISGDRKWFHYNVNINPNENSNNRYATPEEIKTALIAECQKRGIWDVPIVNVDGYERKVKEFDVLFEINENLLVSEYGTVFENGKFATPLQVELSMEEKINEIYSILKNK
jgi:hypothetical protein